MELLYSALFCGLNRACWGRTGVLDGQWSAKLRIPSIALTCAGGWQRTAVLQGQSESLSFLWQAWIRRREESSFAIQIYSFLLFFPILIFLLFSYTDFFPILFPLTNSVLAGFSVYVHAAVRWGFRRRLDSAWWGSCRFAFLLLVHPEPWTCSLGALISGEMNFILMPESLLVPEEGTRQTQSRY